MTEEKTDGKVAIVLVRGKINIRHDIKLTLAQLRLYSKNSCVVIPKNKSTLGMLQKVKDYVTWGDIDEATYKMLIEKKGEEYKGRLKSNNDKIDYSNKYTEVDGKKYKKFFRLNSPKKGFGRKGIKIPFSQGGGIGNRGDKMKDLITNMM